MKLGYIFWGSSELVPLFECVLVLFIMRPCIGQPNTVKQPETLSVGFLDKFGNPTAIIYAGGSLLWACRAQLHIGKPSSQTNKNVCFGNESFALLDQEGQEFQTATCEEDKSIITFRIKVSLNTQFGTYKCAKRYDSNYILEQHSKTISYALCDDRESDCQNSRCSDAESFCIIDQHAGTNTPRTCSKMPSVDVNCALHRKSTSIMCPSKARTVCDALGNGYAKSWMLSGSDTCPSSDESSLRLTYASTTPRLFAESILLDPEHTTFAITHNDPNLPEEVFRCYVRNERAETLDQRNLTLSKSFQVPLDPEVFSKVQALGLFCHNFKSATFSLGSIYITNTLVSLEGPLKVTVSANNELTCGFGYEVTKEFTVNYWWTGRVDQQGNTVRTAGPGEYHCHATIVYRSCNPYREFTKSTTIRYVFTTATPSTSTSTTGSRSTTTSNTATGRTRTSSTTTTTAAPLSTDSSASKASNRGPGVEFGARTTSANSERHSSSASTTNSAASVSKTTTASSGEPASEQVSGATSLACCRVTKQVMAAAGLICLWASHK